MIKRHYESAIIINASVEEDQIEAVISRIEELIKVNGGEILETDKWGRKRLAYTVDKTKSGYYVIFRFTAPSDLISKLERMYQLDEYILRYLTIVLDKFALEYIEKSKIQKEQEKEKELSESTVEPLVQENTEKVD